MNGPVNKRGVCRKSELDISMSFKRFLTFYKLSLVGMQLSEKYKGNFDVSSEDPSYGVTSGGSGKLHELFT